MFLRIFFLFFLAVQAAGLLATELFTPQVARQVVRLQGFTRAAATLPLISEASGYCLQIRAQTGEAIPAEGIFTCLDDTFIRLEIRGNQTEQERLKRQLVFQQTEIRRLRQLVKNNTAAQADLDSMEWQHDNSRYLLRSLQVEAEVLQERLRRLCIKAPAGWLLTERLVETGQWVSVGQKLAQAADFSRLLLPLAVEMPVYRELQQQETLKVRLEESGRYINARLFRTSPAFDAETRKVRVDIELTGQLPEMRGGLRAALDLTMPLQPGVWDVPAGAVGERYEEYFLVRGDGVKIPVIVLERKGGLMRISAPALDPEPGYLLDATGEATTVNMAE